MTFLIACDRAMTVFLTFLKRRLHALARTSKSGQETHRLRSDALRYYP